MRPKLPSWLLVGLLAALSLHTADAATDDYQVLHAFSAFNLEGIDPLGPLVEGADGSYYGTTSLTSAYQGAGTVFKITPGGVLVTLYNFPADGTVGGFPMGGLVAGSDGSFFGTTSVDGPGREGTVFRITPDGELTTRPASAPRVCVTA